MSTVMLQQSAGGGIPDKHISQVQKLGGTVPEMNVPSGIPGLLLIHKPSQTPPEHVSIPGHDPVGGAVAHGCVAPSVQGPKQPPPKHWLVVQTGTGQFLF